MSDAESESDASFGPFPDEAPDGPDDEPRNPGGEPPEGADPDAEWPAGEGQIVDHRPPSVKTRTWRQIWRTRRWLKKRQKLIGDGYVQWYLIGDAVPHPKFVKPKRKGGGIPELEHNGETYLFPRDALVASEEGGWVCMHREGEADPINIADPARLSIPADELKEYLDLRVSSSAPGLLDGLGIDSGDLIKIAIAGIIAFAAFQQMTGGGL